MMKSQQIGLWFSVAAAILGAGMWLGSLESRVTQLEKNEIYFHGTTQSAK
jgi:hypothetical protein